MQESSDMVTFASGATVDSNGVVSTPDAPPMVTDPTVPSGLPPAEVPPAAAGEPAASADVSSEPPTPASEEETAVSPEPPRGNRPFVSRLIRENQTLKDQATAQSAQIAYLTQQLTQRPGQPAPAQPPPGMPSPSPTPPTTAPRIEEYATTEQWMAAYTTWQWQQLRAAERATEQAAAAETAKQRAVQQWQVMEGKGRRTYEDFDEVVTQLNAAPQIAPILADTVRECEHGHALLYYLGSHPADMDTLNALSPLAAARWLGRLEDRLNTPPAHTPPARTTPTPPAPPPPIPPVGGGGETPPVQGFRPGMSLGDYERWVQAQSGRR